MNLHRIGFQNLAFIVIEPPCVTVCPTGATFLFKRDDGIVLIDNDRCTGCKFCINKLPLFCKIFQLGS
ncbi:MAG: 4Fe-4S dicluster domain-containing protein [Flavobacteriaceae bacterium]|nr:4Fe-4S dicluster domain-containing protein [Flavobacteriaceae bacterium]